MAICPTCCGLRGAMGWTRMPRRGAASAGEGCAARSARSQGERRLAAALRRLDRVGEAETQELARDHLMEQKDQLTKLNMLAMDRPFDDQVRLSIARVWLQMGRPREGANLA